MRNWVERVVTRKARATTRERDGEVRHVGMRLANSRVITSGHDDVQQVATKLVKVRRVYRQVEHPITEGARSSYSDRNRFALCDDIVRCAVPRKVISKKRRFDNGDMGERCGIAESPHEERKTTEVGYGRFDGEIVRAHTCPFAAD
jgi:hypothetical protein